MKEQAAQQQWFLDQMAAQREVEAAARGAERGAKLSQLNHCQVTEHHY